VYAVQAVDRTRGAIRRDVPKPKVVIDKLAEGTGGEIFSIEEPQVAAKTICDELRKNRYVLSYVPSSAPFGHARSLLVVGNQRVRVRAREMQHRNEATNYTDEHGFRSVFIRVNPWLISS